MEVAPERRNLRCKLQLDSNGLHSRAMPPVIETRSLSKSYGRLGAVRDLNLNVPEGSVFALLGASGAGKTTTLKVLLNMIAPSAGSARVLGCNSRDIGPDTLTQIGYVSENQSMPARLRVRDFFRYLRNCYPSWDDALEREMRAELGLPAERRIGELSHGMRLKMGLACALPFRPRLLILDEPLSGLDALARDEIIAEFLRRAGEMTILISSHELDEVERLATHVAFLHEGELLFQGEIGALRTHARSQLEQYSASGMSLRDIFVVMVRAARSRATQG